jgi:hypothetical protein
MADYIQKAPALDAIEHEAQVYNVGFTGQKSGQYVSITNSQFYITRRLVSLPNPIVSATGPNVERPL